MSNRFTGGRMPRRTVPLLTLLVPLLVAGCATPKYLARVNEDEVTGKELRDEFARRHMALEKALANEADVRRYLDRAIERKLLVQEGRKAGLDEDPAVLADLSVITRRQAAAQLVRIEIAEKSKATDDEVKAAYAHLSQARDLHELVVADEKEAAAIRARLAAGEDFEAVAREKSTAPSAKSGGRILEFRWGARDEAWERIALGLAKGELSPVFHAAAGWTVLRLDDVRDAKGPPLKAVAARLKALIEDRKYTIREREMVELVWAKHSAKLVGCRADAEQVRKAIGAPAGTTPVCSTWNGGQASLADVAPRANVEKLATAPESERAAALDSVVHQVTSDRLFEVEGLARGYDKLPDVAAKLEAKRAELIELRLYEKYVYRDVSVSDEEVRKYFDEHRSEFADPEKRRLAQIVVPTQEKAEEALAKLKAGAKFDELAAEVSTDPRNAKTGGEVGWLAINELPDNFRDPVFSLQKDGLTPPLRSGVGFHVVKVLDMQPEHRFEFAESREAAKKAALAARYAALRDAWVKRLRADARIEISDKAIKEYADANEATLKEEERKKKEARAAAKAASMPKAKPEAPGTAVEGAAAEGSVPPAAPASAELAPTSDQPLAAPPHTSSETTPQPVGPSKQAPAGISNPVPAK
jgi:parvulin-like peptidyl-prolyl isomerase